MIVLINRLSCACMFLAGLEEHGFYEDNETPWTRNLQISDWSTFEQYVLTLYSSATLLTTVGLGELHLALMSSLALAAHMHCAIKTVFLPTIFFVFTLAPATLQVMSSLGPTRSASCLSL